MSEICQERGIQCSEQERGIQCSEQERGVQCSEQERGIQCSEHALYTLTGKSLITISYMEYVQLTEMWVTVEWNGGGGGEFQPATVGHLQQI